MNSPFHHSTHPIAGEFARLTALLGGLYLWQRLVSGVLSAIPGYPTSFGGIVVDSVIIGGTTIAGVLLFAVVYADHRNISLGFQLPVRSDLWLVGMAGVVPLVGVALTKLVGNVTGVPYNAILLRSIGANATLLPVLKVAGIGVLVHVPIFVIVCQILIQGSLGQIVDTNRAIGLTTVLAGFVLLSTSGGLGFTYPPGEGQLLVVLVVTILIGFGPYLVDHFDPDRRPAVAYGPALLFGAFVVVSGGVPVDSIAGGLFIATHLAVLGVAAYSYDRTGSVLAPAVAYTTLELANTGVIFFFEAGMQNF